MINVLNITKPNKTDDIFDIEFKFYVDKYGNKHCDNIIAYDIEASTGYYINGKAFGFDHDKYNNDENYRKMIDKAQPVSCQYNWQCAVENYDKNIKVFSGRDYKSLSDFLFKLTSEIKRQSMFGFQSLDRDGETQAALFYSKKDVNLMVFIHNLGYEFQHLRNLFEDEFYSKRKQNVFARTSRKPMKVNFKYAKHINIELRDSLVLTQKSLDNWCKDEKLPVMKCDKIDYLKIRHPETPLTDKEIQYCLNDVISMVYGIEKYRIKFGSLRDIPLTQTGIVRKKVCSTLWNEDRDWCMKQWEIMHEYDLDFFHKLCKLFQGGWTHANADYVGRTYDNVRAFDFASSYPAVMTTRKYPVSMFEICDVDEFDDLASQDIHTADYRWFAKLKISTKNGLVMSKLRNTYWSLSKCEEIEGVPVVDNGRIQACQSMTIYLTDIDWDTFQQAYYFDDVECLELYKSEAGYLSTSLIKLILDYFGYKTSLKGTDNESLYVESKQFINSIYGCFVTKIISDTIEFNEEDDGWFREECTEEDFTATINSLKPEKVFGSFQLGCWVTSWARHGLWDFILHFDEKIIYCDTDSQKGLFTDEDIEWINSYNDDIASLEARVATELGIDDSLYTPLTSEGKMKRLGIMEREADAVHFKTLGAKRYVYETEDGKMHCTIAGLPKSAGVNKISKCEDFTNETIWNTKESEKNTACYNDNQPTVEWTDEFGNTYTTTEKYGLAIVPTTFDLSISEEFYKFLLTLKRGYVDYDDEFFNDTPKILR